MTPRERVKTMLDFRGPDLPVLECHPSAAGLYEHGARLQELFRQYPHDFGDFSKPAPAPARPRFIQSDGRYNELRTDAWGVQWRHLIFGRPRPPRAAPPGRLGQTCPRSGRPPRRSPSGPEFEQAQQNAARHREHYYLKAGWGGIFETMHAVRRFEDVLMEIALNTREINRLADMITEYQVESLRYLLAVGVDGLQMGDDYGTQEALLLSRHSWQRFFAPRYQRLLEPRGSGSGHLLPCLRPGL